MKYTAFIISIFLFLTACIDPIIPDYSKIVNENRLVVDASFNVGDGIHEVDINRTFTSGTNGGTTTVSQANVYLEDSLGNIYQLEERLNGNYVIQDQDICLEAGKQFKLLIELANGESFNSPFKKAPEIIKFDKISYRVINKQIFRDERPISVEFLEFNGENNSNQNETLYYQIDYDGSYAYSAPFQGSGECWPACAGQTPPSNLSSSPAICYIFEQVREPLNANSLLPANTEVVLLNFRTDFRFKIEYSMNLKINCIDKDTYNFLKAQAAQIAFGGGLFDSPPTNIIGNIVRTDVEDTYALGNFSISNGYQQRVYVQTIPSIEDGQCNYIPLPPPACMQPPYDYCCDCLLFPNSQENRPSFFP